MLIQTNGDSISYRIISHNSRTPIVAQAMTSKKNYRVVVSYHTIPELQLLHKLRRLKKFTESHLDTSHIPVKSAGALLHAWGKAQTAALAVGSQKKNLWSFGVRGGNYLGGGAEEQTQSDSMALGGGLGYGIIIPYPG